jgi:hypothetical protein
VSTKSGLDQNGMDQYDDNSAWVTALFVIPEYRGKGSEVIVLHIFLGNIIFGYQLMI